MNMGSYLNENEEDHGTSNQSNKQSNKFKFNKTTKKKSKWRAYAHWHSYKKGKNWFDLCLRVTQCDIFIHFDSDGHWKKRTKVNLNLRRKCPISYAMEYYYLCCYSYYYCCLYKIVFSTELVLFRVLTDEVG